MHRGGAFKEYSAIIEIWILNDRLKHEPGNRRPEDIILCDIAILGQMRTLANLRPMRLSRRRKPFDSEDICSS
jgi:hypothetical protein